MTFNHTKKGLVSTKLNKLAIKALFVKYGGSNKPGVRSQIAAELQLNNSYVNRLVGTKSRVESYFRPVQDAKLRKEVHRPPTEKERIRLLASSGKPIANRHSGFALLHRRKDGVD